jgi:hypothetical protein
MNKEKLKNKYGDTKVLVIWDTDIWRIEDRECNYIGDVKNIGILNSFIRLVEHCKTDYFIFCENDFILLDN